VLTTTLLIAALAAGPGPLARAAARANVAAPAPQLLAERIPNRAERLLVKGCLAFNLFGQAFDTVSTLRALRVPGVTEGNPLLRPLASEPRRLIGLKVTLGFASTGFMLLKADDNPRLVAAAACAMGAVGTAAGIHNRNEAKK
jgi:hypothetical protein